MKLLLCAILSLGTFLQNTTHETHRSEATLSVEANAVPFSLLKSLKGLPVDTSTRTVCSLSAIPTGWIITNRTTSINCGEETKFQWTIKKVDEEPSGSTEKVFAIYQIPSGWAIVDRFESASSPHGEGAQWLIKRIDGMCSGTIIKVLSQSEVPKGWVVLKRENCTGCQIPGGLQWIIQKL